MSNLTDALIAAKLVGGSGGSGGGSGLPEIESSVSYLIPEAGYGFTQLSAMFYGHIFNEALSVTADAYTVIWDGTSYECPVLSQNGLYVFGNLSFIGAGADTGEPFCITNSEGADVIVTTSTEASHTVEVFSSSQTPADGSIMQVINGAWQPVVPTSGGTEVCPFTVTLDLKSTQTISQDSSRMVTLNFTNGNFPSTWNTAAGLSCYIKSSNTIYELVLLKVEFDLSTSMAVATILNPLTYDCNIYANDEMYGYAIKLT